MKIIVIREKPEQEWKLNESDSIKLSDIIESIKIIQADVKKHLIYIFYSQTHEWEELAKYIKDNTWISNLQQEAIKYT